MMSNVGNPGGPQILQRPKQSRPFVYNNNNKQRPVRDKPIYNKNVAPPCLQEVNVEPSESIYHPCPPFPYPGVLKTKMDYVPGEFNQRVDLPPNNTTQDTVKDITDNSKKKANETENKEKTPMCLVNELSRHNKITHQYRLTGEAGPAHKKRFTVALKLGEEEYTAEGPSIKKAQHTAASEAMSKTKYPHPPPKFNKTHKSQKTSEHNVTPTVELNSLAMKQGIQVVYMSVNGEGPQDGMSLMMQKKNLRDTGKENAREQFKPFRIPPGSNGPQEFQGKPFNNRRREQVETCKILLKVGEQVFEGTGVTPQQARHNAALRALEVVKPVFQKSTVSVSSSEEKSSLNLSSDLKSPVSLLYEISVRKQVPVVFEVQSEKGPPHMKIFTTICKVGELVTEAEGNGKKISRKRAAEKMLNELKKQESDTPMPDLFPNSDKQKKKANNNKKKNRNLIKEKLEEEEEPINPVSHLLQLQQSKKEKEPVYTLIEERGAPRKREFVMQVEVTGFTTTGFGQNKKAAKKAAAHNLLLMMGVTLPTQPVQPKPEKKPETSSKEKPVLKEPTTKQPKPVTSTVGPKEQLMYLANLLNFQVGFSDFPKGTHGNYLTLLTLSTSPPQLCHGSGSTPEESNSNAAAKALELLRDLGLDIVENKELSSQKKD